MGCYIQRRPMQLGQAPALDGVQVKYRTGSVKHSISTCTSYPVPAEEAREDAGAEQILFHVYKYKVSLHKDSKERRQLKLVVQKQATIGKFHRLYYVPEQDAAATTWRATSLRHNVGANVVPLWPVSSHRDYGERM